MDLDLLREMLKRHEGLRLKPYPCSRGRMTIGYGWNLGNPLPESVAAYLHVNGEITEDIAERLLNISIDTAVRQCWAIFPQFGGFTERRQMALVDMVFNLGASGVMEFRKMRAAIDRGDWSEAAEQVRDSAYWRQLGGDPGGTDDGKLERPEEIAQMLREG